MNTFRLNWFYDFGFVRVEGITKYLASIKQFYIFSYVSLIFCIRVLTLTLKNDPVASL